jgi:alpha-L-fucosidase
MKRTVWVGGLLTLVSNVCGAAEPVDLVKRAEELKALRWGMFVCWSYSTFSGREWTPGVKDLSMFKATGCDTDQWARTAKEAEMGYILFLTKHHDGFCLWDTKTTARKVTRTPLGIDVLAALRRSCDKYGIKLALYFSEGEFKDHKDYHPGGYTPQMKKDQLKELLTQYGPIEYIWFDHAQTDGGLSHDETTKWCKQFQPGCFIGYNHGAKSGDIRLGEMGRPGPVEQKTGIGADHGDANYRGYLLAEFTYPILPGHKGGAQWFYSLPIHDKLCLPAEKLYKDYCGAVRYGNIFSIDVGPDYAGRLREIDIETLRRVGQMIRDKSPEPAAAAPPAPVAQLKLPPSLAKGKAASASSTWSAGYEAAKAFDADEATRWGGAPESRDGWLQVDLGQDTLVGQVVVQEIAYPRTESFVFECREGERWRELAKGSTLGPAKLLEFAPVTARVFRLRILAASEVPTIEEVHLFAPGTVKPDQLKAAAAGGVSEEELKAREKRLAWFHQAKYGLFINWGLYSIPAGEWKGKPYGGIGEWIMHQAKIPVKEYEQLARQFNPQKFNADEWAQLAVDAGMKYLVFDCKHHDGFALYRSRVSAYNCYDATPWRRDPFQELQAACVKRGIKLCFYYSQATDWHEPNGANNEWDFKPNTQKDFDQYLRDKSLPQVKELLTGYGPIGLIWFDVPSLMTPERSKQFVDLVRSLQPDTLINSRLGAGGLHDYQSRGDNEIPNLVTPGAWETAATINDTWGYKRNDHRWKTPADICFKLVDIVSKGGNYLLNVGPDGDGFIPQPSQDNLRTVGTWLKLHGEAVYGAGRTPFGDELGQAVPAAAGKRPGFAPKRDWRCTTQPGKLYFHLFTWPGERFAVDGVKAKAAKAYLLADRTPLAVTQDAGKLTISLPAAAPQQLVNVVCVELAP